METLKNREDDDDLEVPKITKALPIIKWTKAFQDYLHQIIGVQMIPLAYIIQAQVDVPVAPLLLMNNQPHSEGNGLIKGEMIS